MRTARPADPQLIGTEGATAPSGSSATGAVPIATDGRDGDGPSVSIGSRAGIQAAERSGVYAYRGGTATTGPRSPSRMDPADPALAG